MSSRPILDAGPGLNFLALHKERLLFSAVGPLSAPACVEEEILRKAQADSRFEAADRVWRKLSERLMSVLPDDPTPELESAVERISSLPLDERYQRRRDLGETMVVAHAAVAADRGVRMIVLIDDQWGRRLAAAEQRRLERLRSNGRPVGRIDLISTTTVLERAAGSVHLPDRASLRALYQRLRTLDDGLLPLQTTGLLDLPAWNRH